MMVTKPVSMIDFHTHILPGIDDGSKSVEQSVEMLRLEAEQGITDVVLTSHFYASQNNIKQYLKSRDSAYNELKSCLNDSLPSVHLGAEVQYFEGISVTDDIVDLRIDGTKLLLLEMPFSNWSDRVIQDVLELNERKDIQILLAHVDRYISFQDSKLWPYLAERGILMQANTSFFRGFFSRKKAIRMVEEGLIHVLGTDCHGLNNRTPDWSAVPDRILEQINSVSYLQETAPVTL